MMTNKTPVSRPRRPQRRKTKFHWWLCNLLVVILTPWLLFHVERQETADVIFQVKQNQKSFPPVTQKAAVSAQAFVLVDNQTGQIIYQKNPQQRLPIASISKIIPAYLIYEALKSGQIKLTDRIRVAPDLANLSTMAGLSNVKLQPQQSYTVQDLLAATLLSSANAGVMALARAVAPLPEFNQKEHNFLRQLGITDFVIVNVNGLPNEMLGNLRNPRTPVKAENEMSATAVGIVAAKLVRDFPQILALTQKATATFKAGSAEAQRLVNTNELVAGNSLAQPHQKVLGLKTGTNEFGYSFVGTFKAAGQLFTTVILNAESDASRFLASSRLFQKFQQQYHQITFDLSTNPNLKLIQQNFNQQFNLQASQLKPVTIWAPRTVKAADFHFAVAFDQEYFAQNKKPGLILHLATNSTAPQFLPGQNPALYLR